MGSTLSATDCAGDIGSFTWISGIGWVWFWSCRDSGKTGGLISFSVWWGSSIWLLGSAGGSRVDRSWRRFLRKRRPSTSTSYDRRPRGRVQWPKLHFYSPGFFMRMESPAFKGARFLVPLLYCLHCNLFLAARLLAVVVRSLFGWRSFSAVGSKVQVRRPISLWAGEVLNPSLGVFRKSRIANSGSFLSSLAFMSSPLQVFTKFSTFPFDCGYLGLDVRCSNCHWEEKLLNSWLSNSGPLSVISTSGNTMASKLHLKLSNNSLCCLLVDLNDFKETGPVIHHYQKCLLAKVKQISGYLLPRAWRQLMWLKLFTWQRETKSLISAPIRGQYNISRARRIHPPMPMWLLWSWFNNI